MAMILVAVSTRYIGSHAVVDLLELGYSVPLLDDLVNSTTVVLYPIEEITGTKPEVVRGDARAADERWSIEALRHFYPIGAHESGFIGEDPRALPNNNLMPFIYKPGSGRETRASTNFW